MVSEIEELDMFVTGTNAYGRVFTEFDSQGHPINVKDHRQVFQLSYRKDRKNDFESEGAAALAKLSRTTSCFPVDSVSTATTAIGLPRSSGRSCCSTLAE
jgi:hypothetical protein